MADFIRIRLGNESPLASDVDGPAVTTFDLPPDTPPDEGATIVRAAFDGYHSGEAPSWVEGDDDLIVELLARRYDCKVGKPARWQGADTEEASA